MAEPSKNIFREETVCLMAGAHAAGNLLVTKRKHPFRPVSTRVARPGFHCFDVTVNGESLAEQRLGLAAPPSEAVGSAAR